MAKRYYWLKLDAPFFNDAKIKKLRKLAGGDTFTIIYLKMMMLSLEKAGYLLYENIEDSFEKEIALKIDEDIENVVVTVNYLKLQGLLRDCGNNEYSMPQVLTRIGSETDKAQLMRRKRAMDKLSGNNVTSMLPNCYTDKDIDIDIDLYKERDLCAPSIDQVKDFCKDNCLSVNPDKFYYYYLGRSWKINGEIFDWKAKLFEWNAGDSNNSLSEGESIVSDYNREE